MVLSRGKEYLQMDTYTVIELDDTEFGITYTDSPDEDNLFSLLTYQTRDEAQKLTDGLNVAFRDGYAKACQKVSIFARSEIEKTGLSPE
jgi:hypothetical protein